MSCEDKLLDDEDKKCDNQKIKIKIMKFDWLAFFQSIIFILHGSFFPNFTHCPLILKCDIEN